MHTGAHVAVTHPAQKQLAVCSYLIAIGSAQVHAAAHHVNDLRHAALADRVGLHTCGRGVNHFRHVSLSYGHQETLYDAKLPTLLGDAQHALAGLCSRV